MATVTVSALLERILSHKFTFSLLRYMHTKKELNCGKYSKLSTYLLTQTINYCGGKTCGCTNSKFTVKKEMLFCKFQEHNRVDQMIQ